MSDQNLTNLIRQSAVFVCEHEAKIVGMIYLVPSGNPTEFFKKEWSYIRFLGVHTKYRGLKIGKKLTEMCIAAAKKNKEKHEKKKRKKKEKRRKKQEESRRNNIKERRNNKNQEEMRGGKKHEIKKEKKEKEKRKKKK